MNKNARMAAIVANAERHFANYAGGEQAVGVEDSVYGSMAGAAAPVLDVESGIKEITATITNSDEVNQLYAPLFSANERREAAFDGGVDGYNGKVATAGKGVVVSYDGYTEQEIIDMCRTKPFVIAGLRYIYEDNAQQKLKWEVRQKEGQTISTTPYRPYKNLQDSIDGQLEDVNFRLLVNGGITLWVPIAKALDATTPREVQVIFKVATSTDISNALKGRSAVKKHGAQYMPNQSARLF